jgi:probable rRNA maturation factor
MTVEVRNRQPRRPSGLRVDARSLKTLATRALELAGAAANYNLSIVLVNDRQIASLNARFHHVQGPTDVLSFDYGKGHGELIISVEHVRAQARRFHTTPGRELALYVVHGILHLHGHDDLTPCDRRRMRAEERRLIRRLTRSQTLQEIILQ